MAGTENRFSNKVVIVTGGAKGIGRACVEAFLRQGAKVAAISRTQPELDSLYKSLNSPEKFMILRGDVSQEADVKALFDSVEERLGSVNILVNNAAIVKNQSITELSLEDWNAVLKINIGGVFLCSRELFKRRQSNKEPASIVNISSLAGIRATDKFPGFASYVASKFAVVGLTECLAVEGRSLGIRANCIAPGAVDTEMLRKAAPQLKTRTTPSDIAHSVLFLADEAQTGKMSGTTLEIFSNIS